MVISSWGYIYYTSSFSSPCILLFSILHHFMVPSKTIPYFLLLQLKTNITIKVQKRNTFSHLAFVLHFSICVSVAHVLSVFLGFFFFFAPLRQHQLRVRRWIFYECSGYKWIFLRIHEEHKDTYYPDNTVLSE